MADCACINNSNGRVVNATDEGLRKEVRYYCTTPGCDVQMFLVSGDERGAHFRTKAHAKHISITCTKNNIDFTPDAYTDDGFTLANFNNYIFGGMNALNIHVAPVVGRERAAVGRGELIVPHTLKQLYYCLIQRDLDEPFGDIETIGDILVCRDNFQQYAFGFDDVKICEFTFYKYNEPSFDENNSPIHGAFYVNIPSFLTANHIIAKLIIDDDRLFRKIRDHFIRIPKSKKHDELCVVMGYWHPSENNQASVECHIRSQKQITYVE